MADKLWNWFLSLILDSGELDENKSYTPNGSVPNLMATKDIESKKLSKVNKDGKGK